MGKKTRRQFIDKKGAQTFRLIPGSCTQNNTSESFQPTKEHLEAQHKFGVFFDDNYDYTQHMRDRNEKNIMIAVDEERTVVKAAPSIPSVDTTKRVVFDEDVDKALEGEGDVGEGDLEDDFIEMAGGVVEEKLLLPRMNRIMEDSDDESDEGDDDMFNRGYEDYDMEDEEESEDEGGEERHVGVNRAVDTAFDALLDADYGDDQVGELEGEAVDISGGLEPSDARIRKLIGEKRGLPQYDPELAKKLVRERMKAMEGKEERDEMEEIEVEVGASKRMKWDCESFATQNSNIYNHPSLIKEPVSSKLSKRALRRLEKESEPVEEENEDEEMEEDGESVCTTTTTIRPRGETTEERKMRKGAVKEARKIRRTEKKENKIAFAVEHRKMTAAKVGVIKATPIV